MNEFDGLTIRDYIAIEMMKGVLPTGWDDASDATKKAQTAYLYADALIAESIKQ